MQTTHAQEIRNGERFSFGENWAQFLGMLDETRIEKACHSLQEKLGLSDLSGKTFIDIGSGSGLFSLAARRLGAKVFSFDYDPQSVACTTELKNRYFPSDENWTIQTGSILDTDYLNTLGSFDIVYSWGVLHHTGDMWTALKNAERLVAPHGLLFIAIYNDQGRASKLWWSIKKLYVSSPASLRWILVALCYVRLWGFTTLVDFIRLHPFKTWENYRKNRGMSPHTDVIDWVGGFPFEVAKPEDIFHFYRLRNFSLKNLKTCAGGIGCNEYVFLREAMMDIT